MIETTPYGRVTQFKMGRDLGGQVLYWVAAYLVDGLLIDTGCHHTAEELLDSLQGKEVKSIFLLTITKTISAELPCCSKS